MAEMRASPVKSKALKRLADIVRMAEEQGQMEFLPVNPMSLFPVSSSTLENLAYGNLPMAIPSQSNIPITKTGRKQEVAELAGLLPTLPAASRGVTQGANYLGDVMTQSVTRNPQATSMRALEEIGRMSPVPQMADVFEKSKKSFAVTPSQKTALDSYIESSAPYNDALRGEGPDLGEQGLAVVKELDGLFKAAPPLSEDLVVYRAVPSFTYKNPADTDEGFVSATKSLDEAKKFLKEYDLDRIVEIRIPKGTPIVEPGKLYPGYNYQEEILLPRGGTLSGGESKKVFKFK
jgi:hypothetical protein